MPDTSTIEELIERLPWVDHVVKNGSREHVTIFGVYDDGATVVPITWCTSPFCRDNRSMVEYCLDRGLSPIDMQPPPRLLRALQGSMGDE